MSGSATLSRNNLDCLRLLLASTVALFHVYALTDLDAFAVLGRYLSPHFAVRGFFIISGMLIYRSYDRSSSVRSYFEKRVRRIYPAYFSVVVLAGIAFFSLSTAPANQYFGLAFWKYLVANLLFLNFIAPTLPGLFDTHINNAVNGALWTLKIEVAFYAFIPTIHFLCRRYGTRKIMLAIFCFSCIWKYGFAMLDLQYRSQNLFASEGSRSIFEKMDAQFPAQLAYFCAGILLLLYFDKLKSHFLSISFITAALYFTDHFFTGEYLDIFWISGLVFVFGFWHYLGNFSKYGDFSYGVYIVHWPVLQTLISLGFAKQSPLVFLGLALSSIGISAFLLWHLVEKRFLASSSHYLHGSGRKPVPAIENAVADLPTP